MFESYEAFYVSDMQGLYALCVVPLVFLVWRLARGSETRPGAEPVAARFVDAYAIVFALETMLDPIATGPLLRWLGAEGLGGIVMIPFVLIGDFRVFLLVFHVAEPGRGVAGAIGRAAAWTLVVPLVAVAGDQLLRAWLGPLHPQILWLLYEVAFLALARWLRIRWIPAHVAPERPSVRRWLEGLADFVSLYYAFWAAADAVILFAGLDAGWGVRVIPNLLYYGFWVPFAWVTFFSPSPNAER